MIPQSLSALLPFRFKQFKLTAGRFNLLYRHSAVGTDASSRRVNGLDSIRFLCALVVMLFHLRLINDRLYGQSDVGLTRAAIGIFNAFFNGPAAVIVFFVISGFCIHYPYRADRRLSIVPFYIRRFIPSSLPAGFCYLCMRWLFNDRTRFQDGVYWSVICEAIYYLHDLSAASHTAPKIQLASSVSCFRCSGWATHSPLIPVRLVTDSTVTSP